MDTDRKIVLWNCENDGDEEVLTAKSKNEAIEDYLDGIAESIEDGLGAMPEKVTVYGYAVMEIPEPDSERLCENILEDWGEFDDPEEGSEPTETMLAAGRLFLQIMKSEFKVWAHEHVTQEEIDVKRWIRLNCPHWLEPKTT